MRTIPARLVDASRLRRSFRRWLTERDLSPEDVDRWELAFSELLTNACVASPPGSDVDVDGRRSGSRLTLRVRNRSDGRSVPRVRAASTLESHGRGLYIVDQLLDGLVFSTSDGDIIATAWTDDLPR